MNLKLILKYWKELIIFVLVVIISISVNTCSNKNKEIERKDSDISLLKNARDSAYNVATYYHGRNGQLIGQVKTQKVTISQIKDYADQIGIDKKALQQQIGNLNNLVVYYKGKATAKDTFSTVGINTVIIYKGKLDSAKIFTSRPSKYLSLDQLYHPSDQTLSTYYEYNVDFSLTAYKRKVEGSKWYNEKTEIVTDITFSDPAIRVGEFKGFVVTEEKKKQQPWWVKLLQSFGLGVVVGVLASR